MIISSLTPASAVASRRITSRDIPSGPQGTNCRNARTTPSCRAATNTHSGSPSSSSRPRAIEKPRSVALDRHAAASASARSRTSAVTSRTRQTSTAYPARATRPTIWRTLRIGRPSRVKVRGVDDGLVAELERGEPGLAHPHGAGVLGAPEHRGGPGVGAAPRARNACDRARPRLRVADGVTAGEHHARTRRGRRWPTCPTRTRPPTCRGGC